MCVAFGALGSYVVLFEDGAVSWKGLSDSHAAKLRDRTNVSYVSLGAKNEMFVRYSSNKVAWVSPPRDASSKVDNLRRRGVSVRQVLFSAHDDEYYVHS